MTRLYNLTTIIYRRWIPTTFPLLYFSFWFALKLIFPIRHYCYICSKRRHDWQVVGTGPPKSISSGTVNAPSQFVIRFCFQFGKVLISFSFKVWSGGDCVADDPGTLPQQLVTMVENRLLVRNRHQLNRPVHYPSRHLSSPLSLQADRESPVIGRKIYILCHHHLIL